jgi:hypothetical protein
MPYMLYTQVSTRLLTSASERLKGIYPKGNIKVVIIIFHVYDKCLFLMHARIVLTRNVNTYVFNKQPKGS